MRRKRSPGLYDAHDSGNDKRSNPNIKHDNGWNMNVGSNFINYDTSQQSNVKDLDTEEADLQDNHKDKDSAKGTTTNKLEKELISSMIEVSS